MKTNKRVIAIAIAALVSFSQAQAWTEPTGAPPSQSIGAPINTGGNAQYKSGASGFGGVLRGYSNAYFDGNVGIGTTSPAYKLDVENSGGWKARFGGPDGYIDMGPANNGWAHIYTDRPNFIFNQNVWSIPGGFSSYSSADLSLQTNGTTRMTIQNSNGNVGIGTNNPTGQMAGTSGLGIYHSNYPAVSFRNDSTYWLWYGAGNTLRMWNSNAGDIIASNTSGNVGIGTTSPSAKLDVYGTTLTRNISFHGTGGDSGNSNNYYGIYQESGPWSSPYPDLRIQYHTGIEYDAYYGYGGHRFYTGYDGTGNPSGLTFSVGDGDQNVRVANSLYAGGEVRACSGGSCTHLRYSGDNNNYLRGNTYFDGILYDENNASYYVNPNNISIFNDVRATRMRVNATTSYANGIDIFAGNIGGIGVYASGGMTSGYGIYAVGNRGVSANGGYAGIDARGDGYGVFGYSADSGPFSWPGGSFGIGVAGAGKTYDFWANGIGVNYGSASSIRWKSNIHPIDGALEKIMNIRGVYYDWDEEHGGTHDMGFIAEEVGKEIPEIVSWDENALGYATGLDYGHVTPVLVEAIKDQQKQIEELKNQIKELKK